MKMLGILNMTETVFRQRCNSVIRSRSLLPMVIGDQKLENT